jgi:pyruvate dehydrogenase E2 component (dihydrolipoamide acetyltransferase)
MPIYPFLMPDIGEGVVEGEVISWLKKVGDPVKKDEPVLTLMTDKATVELPSPYAGVLKKQCYKEGDIAKKGLPLYEIETEAAIQEALKETAFVPEAPKAAPLVQTGKALASPPVRKLAKELHIPLDRVTPSGSHGEVLRSDLAAYHNHPEQEVRWGGIKHLMAEKMTQSHLEIPPFSYFDQADATRLVQLKSTVSEEARKEKHVVTYMAFFIRGLSLLIKQYPLINSSFSDTHVIQHTSHHIGIAMNTPQGLIVPVLKDVQNRSLRDIIIAYEELVEKAKENKLLPSDMKGATITITNFGAVGGSGVYATPIINPPEVAILGVARIHKEPAEYHGEVALRDMLHLSWSFDHRVIDGALAANVSKGFVKLIENPAELL